MSKAGSNPPVNATDVPTTGALDQSGPSELTGESLPAALSTGSPQATTNSAPHGGGSVSPSSVPQSESATTFLWLRRSDQLFVGALLITAFALMGAHWLRLSGWGLRTVEIDRAPASEYAYRLDVNRATWVEWAQLDGIGQTLGERIVADREVNGPFTSVDDVLRVKGIGPKKLDQMRRWLVIDPPSQSK